MGRVFHVLAAAPDGSAPAGGDPFLPDGDQNGPAAQEDDQACADILQPDQIVVRRGDDVTLHFVGVNGGGRTIAVEHYQDQAVKLLHGENQTLRFIADRAGVFPILCPGDPPAVKGKLIVQN
jgi:plastocyanin